MFSYDVFELIASFVSIRDYVRMVRIAISDAPSDLVQRRCASYKKRFVVYNRFWTKISLWVVRQCCREVMGHFSGQHRIHIIYI